MAASEALEDLDQSLIDGKTLKVGINKIYYDKIDGSYIVEEFEYLDDTSTIMGLQRFVREY